MLTKFAKAEILEVKGSHERLTNPTLGKIASYEDYRTSDGYLYTRVIAISSRVNKNHDGWPSEELVKAANTFMGKPIFVDHHNSNPKKARGVIVDVKVHQDEHTASTDNYYASAPDNHRPPTYIELLLEVDAKTYPKLAKAIIDGDIDSVSMGCNVERSRCSHCGHWATSPEEYCKHIRHKGAIFEMTSSTGERHSRKSYEDCYDIGFFEISYVFDPADVTALVKDVRTARSVHAEAGDDLSDDELRRYEEEEKRRDQSRPEQLYDEETFQSQFGPDLQRIQALPTTAEPGQPDGPASHSDIGGFADAAAEALRANGHDPDQIQSDMQARWAPGAREERVRQHDQAGMGRTLDEIRALPDLDDQFNNYLLDNPHLNPDDPRHQSTVKTAENPLPQSMEPHAPQPVDTLRQEKVCNVCGEEMQDGKCDVCGNEEPPEGFNNPDLDKARQIQEQMEQQEAMQAPPMGPTDTGPGMPPPGGAPAPQGPAPAMATANTSYTVNTTNVNGRVASQKVAPIERPILPAQSKLSDVPVNTKVVKDQRRPVESATKEKGMKYTKEQVEGFAGHLVKQGHAATRDEALKLIHLALKKEADGATPADPDGNADQRVPVDAVGGFDQNVSPDQTTNVDQVGGFDNNPESDTEHIDVTKAVDTANSGPTKTWSDTKDQHSPVSPDAGDFNTVNLHSNVKQADGAKPQTGMFGDETKADKVIDLENPLMGEGVVGPQTQTWSEPKANGHAFADPVTNEVFPGIDVHSNAAKAIVSAAKAKWSKAHRLAETEIELGTLDPNRKYERIEELDQQPEEALDARLDTLASVRTAGLSRKTTKLASVGRVPSLRTAGAPAESVISDDSIADSAMFM